MARAGWVSGETQKEAEASVEAERHQVRIVSCREIDLSGLPPLPSGPLPRHWVFRVEDLTPELAAERPQHDDDSEEAIERWVRQFYLKMDTDPELLSSGTIEMFPCPNCEDEVRIELPPAREKSHPGHLAAPIAARTCACLNRKVGRLLRRRSAVMIAAYSAERRPIATSMSSRNGSRIALG